LTSVIAMPQNLSFELIPLIPVWVIALIALGLLALLFYGSRLLLSKDVPVMWVRRFAILRVGVIALFVLCLLQPVLSYSRPVEPRPQLLLLVDTSQSMGLPGPSGRDTRLEESLAALREGGLTTSLRQHYDLHWFAFDRSAYPLEEADLAGIKPIGDTTNYADSLSAAWGTARPAAPGTARALLISDGNDLGAGDTVETARRLGLRLDTLALKVPEETRAAPETVIADVQCARRVLIGSETQFLVTLRGGGAVNRTLVLRLTEDGKEVLTQDVTFDGGKEEQRVRVSYRPNELGLKQYEFRLAPKGGAAAADAPTYRVSVQVVDAKTEVLILEDTWRWEFKFLRRVFENDPSFSFTALLARGGGSYMQFAEPDRRVQLGGYPQSQSELELFNVIVLGDVNPRRWPKGLAAGLGRYVTDSGKSLIVLAGPNLNAIAATPELSTLLPVEVTADSARPVAGPIEVRVSAEGASTPFFAKLSGGDSPALPPLDQIYPPLRKRPAATILLEATKKANAYGPLIVAAEHTVGRGRVLFIGTDTLWKWQTLSSQNEEGQTPYTVFWQQALRALAPARSYAGAANLWLQPNRSRYEVGQRVLVRAELQSERPVNQPKVQGTVTLPDERRLPLAFAADPTDPTHFRAEFEAVAPGQHRIAASVLSEGQTVADVTTALDVDQPKAELAGTRIDTAHLAHLSAATGGRQIDPADSATWPTGDEVAGRSVRLPNTVDFWNNGSLLVLLCGLLFCDWLLRLVRGYV
jgi:hypothetical protein